MRVLSVALLVLLAGCTLPGDEPAAKPELFGSCPHWIAGEPVLADATLNGSARLDLAFPIHDLRGDPLDMFVLSFTSDAPIQVKVHAADGRRLLVKDGDDTVGLSFVDVDGEREVRAFLTSTEQGAAPAPSDIYLELSGDGTLSVSAIPFYRVCGVLLEN